VQPVPLAPAHAWALGQGNTAGSWREHKTTQGYLIDVASNRVVLHGMAMPHSPRLHQQQLIWLESGERTLICTNPTCLRAEQAMPWQAVSETSIEPPGFTRGLDCFGELAAVGVSQIHETDLSGALPLEARCRERRCGIALVDLSERELLARTWFNSGMQEIFSVAFLPGWRNPVVIGPNPELDQQPTIRHNGPSVI
jgi:uncharacterized protein (TIGR03032 family)